MIDWGAVLSNGLWVAGLATLLAAFSAADWQGGARPDDGLGGSCSKAGAKWIAFAQSRGLTLGIALFCLGSGLTACQGWARALWLVLAAAAGALAAWPRPAGPRDPAR